jgi:antitoxin component YwqK of YwqJK toxin-antitoxin module
MHTPRYSFMMVALLSLIRMNLYSQTTNNYTYIADTRAKEGVKIGKSTLNKYLDTTDFIYQGGCILPNSYKSQNLKDGKYYQYFLQDTAKIAFELTYQNRKLKSFRSFWFNDTLKQQGQLTDGMNEGVWRGYYRSGIIREVFYWTSGVHHEFIFYHPNGNPERHGKELEIGNGKYRLWEYVYYYENGQPSEKGQWKNYDKIGIWHYYNEDGTIRETKNHDEAELP